MTAGRENKVPGNVALVIPCYNEAARLPRSGFERAGQGGRGIEFIFVDDGSADGTAEILSDICARAPETCSLLRLPRNAGKGEAVRRGMLRALSRPCAYVGYLDADLSTPLAEIEPMCRVLDEMETVEMVLGSRVKLLGKDIQRRMLRHYTGRIFATAASWALHLQVYDTQCGAKVMRNSAVTARLFEKPFLASWIFDVEILARFLQDQAAAGVTAPDELLYEHPLAAWRDVAGSKLRLGNYLRAALDLWRISMTYGNWRKKAGLRKKA